jgi:antitoxin component of RelBE/YafQ-DinJ toxin-antitoxin module
MPIQPKNKLIQIRLDEALFDRFTAIADSNNATVSGMVRALMWRYIEQFENRTRKEAEWAATLASRAAAVAASESPVKQLVEPVVASEGPLARKRRLEKEAKESRMAKRHNRY